MGRRSKRVFGFTISWPFIIACIIGFNVFFGEDDPVDKTSIEPMQQEETTNSKGVQLKDAIKEVTEKIKTSEELKKAKEEIFSIASEFKKSLEADNDAEKEEKPKDDPPPKIMTAEETPTVDEPAKLEDDTSPFKPLDDDSSPEDGMKSL